MSTLKIQTGKDNSILRKKTEKVEEITPKIKELVSDMIETCKAVDGVGLAANQIGKSLQIFIVRVPLPDSDYFIKEFINPKILKLSLKKVITEEGCLSLPNFYANVERSEKLKIGYQNKDGAKQILEASDFLARVIQHEMDHLDGILISDKITN